MKDLLLLLAYYPFKEADRNTLSKLLTSVNDWDVFAKLVNDHGIVALTAYNIKESGLGKLVPAKTMEILENGLMKSVVRNSWLTERWKEADAILSKAGIRHILLKGMSLEYTLYEGKGLRQMNDNDILIRREEALIAWSLLKDNGFVSKPLKSPLHEKILPDLGKHLPELYKDGYSLEIHTRLFDEDSPDKSFYDDIFERAVEIMINDDRALILPADINIRFLVKHFNYHKQEGDCQLRLYTDIKLLDAENTLEFPESLIFEPSQKSKPGFQKESYRNTFMAVPPKYRIRFLVGDIFPTLQWMRERYRCDSVGAVLRYPLRLGKALWIVF